MQELRSQLTKGGKFKKANLVGLGMQSPVTNSSYLTEVLEKADCTTKEKVEKVLVLMSARKAKQTRQQARRSHQRLQIHLQPHVRLRRQTSMVELRGW